VKQKAVQIIREEQLRKFSKICQDNCFPGRESSFRIWSST